MKGHCERAGGRSHWARMVGKWKDEHRGRNHRCVCEREGEKGLIIKKTKPWRKESGLGGERITLTL